VRALLSVSDKTGIAELAQGLVVLGWEVIATGNTARAITSAGIPVTEVSEVTGFPEILDGRVKTLHPAIHGGLLARSDDERHTIELSQHGIAPIGLVASNLYPFAKTIADPSASFADIVEQIDIGGPAMVRAAAKNHASVLIVTEPGDYPLVLNALRDDTVTSELRRSLAAKAFAHTATYDALIAGYFQSSDAHAPAFPAELAVGLQRARTLRYGENPHQEAAAYWRLTAGVKTPGLLAAEQLGGKELSFNNFLDGDAAWRAASIGREPTVAIVKHLIPCGLASRASAHDAFMDALAGDPVSAFGGIVASNREIDVATAREMTKVFFEIVIAPAFTPEALEVLHKKKNLRLLRLAPWSAPEHPALDLRAITGAVLAQQPDITPDDASGWTVATKRQPTRAEMDDLRFAWSAIRFVKSNAIVLVKDRAIIGVGAGQPNRVESVAIAARKADERAQGAVLASDAYFPFADGVETAIEAGITAVIQPGGSIRDGEVIAAADSAGIAMVMTGERHFLH
jgi:phosphoribosylaminoimidazolecarboxamide formyltransferase/IMP cyclohydrolase